MKNEIDYSLIPEHMRDGIRLYLEHGLMPGSFLRFVLENNLVEAVTHADRINRTHLVEWAKFLYNEMPLDSWGSKEIVEAWSKKGGSNKFENSECLEEK